MSVPNPATSPGPLPGTGPRRSFFELYDTASKAVRERIGTYIILVAVVLLVGLLMYKESFGSQPTVQLGQSTFNVSIADSEEEQVKGLGGTSNLGPSEGMLFVYGQEDYYGMWMKDMEFSIDVIWFDANKQVVKVEHNVTPDTYPRAFVPDRPAMYVLEIPAGAASQAGVQPGQTAKFDL